MMSPVCIFHDSECLSLLDQFGESEGESFSCFFADELKRLRPRREDLSNYVQEQLGSFKAEEIKRATVLGSGVGALSAIYLALLDAKFTRRLVLVDPIVRPYSSLFSKAVDCLEQFFPLGLPLRKLSSDYDPRSSLQRVTCPTLVVSSSCVGRFSKEQAEFISQRIPNAWFCDLASCELSFIDVLLDFLQVPTKCPQKNRI